MAKRNNVEYAMSWFERKSFRDCYHDSSGYLSSNLEMGWVRSERILEDVNDDIGAVEKYLNMKEGMKKRSKSRLIKFRLTKYILLAK